MQEKIVYLRGEDDSCQMNMTPGEIQRLNYMIEMLEQMRKMALRLKYTYLSDLIELAEDEGKRLRGE